MVLGEKESMKTSLRIYTDGGCSGNPGPGGWAYVIVMETFQGDKVLAWQYGAEKDTTNNRMELSAVIEALRALKSLDGVSKKVRLLTDSQYVQKGITEWIFNWKKKSWRTSDRKPVKNQDLWMELDSLASEFSIAWEWVRGHSGVEYNEQCDRMTQQAIKSIGR